mgnify:CR=1 FL=1
MEVGKLYSCKWASLPSNKERGWDLLLFLGAQDPRYYHFYDLVHGEKRILDEGIIKYCKEITKETTCTQ